MYLHYSKPIKSCNHVISTFLMTKLTPPWINRHLNARVLSLVPCKFIFTDVHVKTITVWIEFSCSLSSYAILNIVHNFVFLNFPYFVYFDIFQENTSNGEILNSLKYVRPGEGYKPAFTIFEKCIVNGSDTHPVFSYLKDKLPYPDDDPMSLMQDPKYLVWSPISRNDISWNFEKFLIGPEGEPFKRYSRKFQTINIEPDIQRLLKLTSKTH